jgi:sulfonate transport system permease protein
MARIVHGFKLGVRKYYILFVIAIFLASMFLVALISSQQNINIGSIFLDLILSTFRLLCAYAISLLLATIIALLIGQRKIGDALIPLFDLMQNLPSFALIPLFILFFGYSNLMIIIFAATSILWPILFYALHAIRAGKTELNDVATIFNAKGWKKSIYYHLPLIFPALITGSIVGISIGWEAVIGVEILGMPGGIGKFLNSALTQDKTAFTLGLFLLLLLVFIINRLIWMPLLKKAQKYEE